MRTIETLTYGWKFKKSLALDIYRRTADDTDYKEVRLPHDYAIEGPFDAKYDAQYTGIDADGRPSGELQTGRTGGLPIGERAVYRKRIYIDTCHCNDVITLEFGGVMANATIYVNDQKVLEQHYGYTSFEADITPFVIFGEENLISVVTEPQYGFSRWYTGAGIYRKVQLLYKNHAHVAYNGSYITTELSDGNAKVKLQTEVANGDALEGLFLVSRILDAEGKECGQTKSPVHINKLQTVFQSINLENPRLWESKNGYLYRLVSEVYHKEKLLDSYETPFGVRSVEISLKNGFLLNGKKLQIKGVCMHHDMGALGAAVYPDALERQLDILLDMGCNSIRTSHNPPCSELLELCDKKGILVLDEAFDEWRYLSKVDRGYAFRFDECAESDLTSLIKRDRNHPSVWLWSIGNEVMDIQVEQGAATARWLADICHKVDPSRLVTAGFNNAVNAFKNGLAGEMDVAGVNYFIDCYPMFKEEYPNIILLATETSSCVSSRGEYTFPVVEDCGMDKPAKNSHISSYDLASPGWGCSPDKQFAALEDYPYVMGEYVWTGFDYLGEPTPFYEQWPSRSSYFGILDLAGLPKDRFYAYQSQWTDNEVLHIFPHWNWEGLEGKTIPVHCYTSYKRVELFVNGVSQGIRQKDSQQVYSRYRLVWDNVVYTPGELKAVALDENGNALKTVAIQTSAAPAKMEIITNKAALLNNGENLVYATVKIVDINGNLCPNADNSIEFTVENGEFLVSDAGDQTSLIPFSQAEKPAFHGYITAVARSLSNSSGSLKITAKSNGLGTALSEVSLITQ